MDMLPDEVLTMIFDFLPSHVVCASVARVCRRWSRLTSNRVVVVRGARSFRRWRGGKGVKSMFLMARDPTLLASLPYLPNASHLTELTVHMGLPLSSKELISLSELQLRHVDVFSRSEVLSDAAVPVAARVSSLVVNEPAAQGYLRAVAKRARLTALHMYGRAGSYPRGELAEVFCANTSRLTELTLRCATLRDTDYAAIGRCTLLWSLKLYSCWEMTPNSAMHIMRLQGLRTLHLTGTRRFIDTASLHRLVSSLPRRLGELSLSASRLSAEHVLSLAARAPQVRVLELWRTQLDAPALVRLAAHLHCLTELDADLSLSRWLIQLLSRHPTLQTVRCNLPKEKLSTHLTLLSTEDCHGGCVRRPEGESYRAQLFYYCTLDVALRASALPTPGLRDRWRTIPF